MGERQPHAERHFFSILLGGALRVNPDERPASTAPFVKWAARCDSPPQDLVDEWSNEAAPQTDQWNRTNRVADS